MPLQNPVSQLIVKAWTDPDFKKKLIADPYNILKAEGLQVDPKVKIHIHENTDSEIHYVLPSGPTNLPLSDADIERAVLAGPTSAGGDCL